MPLRRTALELSVERELPGPDPDRPSRARLTARFEVPPDGSGPSPPELAEALARLRKELEESVGTGPPAMSARAERGLAELVDTYRPRQAELVELLREEGELTPREASLLGEYLARGGARSPTPTGAALEHRGSPLTTPPIPLATSTVAPSARPLAAAPLENDRTPSSPRPVPELLGQFQITSLKQAGAVRARRQISFEEYMALKRHFATADATPASPVR